LASPFLTGRLPGPVPAPRNFFLYLGPDFIYYLAKLAPALDSAKPHRAQATPQKESGMNKSQLIEALAKAENITLKKAEMVVNAVFENMADALAQEERIEIRGFGSFKVKYYNGYKGRNPKTGDLIKVDGKRLPFFKVGKEMRERVDR
jgi:integration host factor subunit beta